MLRYLLIIMAIISVPAVLPPFTREIPIPAPHMIPEITAHMNLSSNRGSCIKFCNTLNRKELMKIA